MPIDLDPETVKQTAPGLFGALGAIWFLRGSWPVRVGLAVPGCALSYFAADEISRVSGMPPGLSGFLVGLLGMVFVAKVVETWQGLDLSAIIKRWLQKRLGVDSD